MTVSTALSNAPELGAEASTKASRFGPRNALFAAAGAIGVGAAGIGAVVSPGIAPVLIPVAVLIGAASVCGLVGSARERALHEARQRAEAANEAKTKLLATVSHEFRTPLNGILGLTGLMLESKLTPEQETYARGVRSSGEALLSLVDEMLDLSRIEAGGLALHPVPSDLRVLLRDIGELLAPRAHAKSIDLAVDGRTNLPWRVVVDVGRLRQVLINLADNAIKFTDEGGVVLRAERQSGAEAEGARIAFSVEDTGPGIDRSEIDRIFREFEQLERGSERRHGGAGLGLAISRRIVAGLGGKLEFEPRPGGGSKFSFSLELEIDEEGREDPEKPLAGVNALIVSPGSVEPDILARGLTGAGASVAIADGVDNALAEVGLKTTSKTSPNGVLLLDHRAMADPVAALWRLRRQARRRLPAVILIEPGQRDALPALRESGFDAYLIRPVRRCSSIKIVADVVSAPGLFRADPDDDSHDTASLDILLAEDNEINAMLVRSILESLGHRVTEVPDGRSAIDAFTDRWQPFSAVLMDLHMPGLDGITAASMIRNFEMRTGRRPAKIIALTADVLPETRVRAVEAGIDLVIEKPISADSLRRALVGVGQDFESAA